MHAAGLVLLSYDLTIRFARGNICRPAPASLFEHRVPAWGGCAGVVDHRHMRPLTMYMLDRAQLCGGRIRNGRAIEIPPEGRGIHAQDTGG